MKRSIIIIRDALEEIEELASKIGDQENDEVFSERGKIRGDCVNKINGAVLLAQAALADLIILSKSHDPALLDAAKDKIQTKGAGP